MFDFAWSEIALIVVVAVIFIGPKDLPVAIKAVTEMIKKARRMAGEFQTHVDEMVRDADLQDVRNSINEIRNFDLKGTVERAVDPDGSLRSTFASNPLEPTTPAPADTVTDSATDAAHIEAHSAAELTRPEGVDAVAEAEPEPEPDDAPPSWFCQQILKKQFYFKNSCCQNYERLHIMQNKGNQMQPHFSDSERPQLLDMQKLRMDQHWRRREIGDSTYLRSLFIMGYLPDDANTELNLLKLERR